MSAEPHPAAPAPLRQRPSPLPGAARPFLAEMADWNAERRQDIRTTTIQQLDLVDAKAATLLQFIGILVAVAAIVGSLASLRSPAGGMAQDIQFLLMVALMVAVLAAGGYGLSCIHMFDMSARLRRNRPELSREDFVSESTAWLRHTLASRRARYRTAYVLTWLSFVLIMTLVMLHVFGEGRA